MSLLKDPVFMFIGISNFFGMAGLYVPFVFLVDVAVKDVSIKISQNSLTFCVYITINTMRLFVIRLLLLMDSRLLS